MTDIEKQPIHESDWDYLIVLDACRYDYFKDNYENHLEGELDKVESRGSATPEWLVETFSSRYNYTYITANPYVNSKESLDNLVNELEEKWVPRDKFMEIHEAWAEIWDEETGTVRPEELKKYSLDKISGGPGKTIIHFVQPHRPFISYQGEEGHTWMPNKEENKQDLKNKTLSKTQPIWKPIFHTLPRKWKYKIRGMAGMEDQYREFAENIGEEKLTELYTKDLNLVLEQISEIVEKLDGKVVVTADHGESFGENYEWGHPLNSKNPVLVEVPWLEVER